MAKVFDVAKYILKKTGPISAIKLQKLTYYSQAWSLVWDDEELFPDEFEAWANGPVVRALYNEHKGLFKVDFDDISSGKPNALTESEQETIDKVLEFYGDKSAQWLSNLTHSEDPWIEARGDIAHMASCSNIITKASMAEYYSAL